MKLIIAGVRYFDDWFYVFERLDSIVFVQSDFGKDIEVISGCSEEYSNSLKGKGIDFLGANWAKKRGLKVNYFPADWDKHGKAAGPIRNGQMAEIATHCIAFWDGKSPGTKNMIEHCKKKKIKLIIERIDD